MPAHVNVPTHVRVYMCAPLEGAASLLLSFINPHSLRARGGFLPSVVPHPRQKGTKTGLETARTFATLVSSEDFRYEILKQADSDEDVCGCASCRVPTSTRSRLPLKPLALLTSH
jgi:hypothetical protein